MLEPAQSGGSNVRPTPNTTKRCFQQRLKKSCANSRKISTIILDFIQCVKIRKMLFFFFQQRNVVFQIIIQSIRLVVISFCWPKKKLMVKKSLQFMWSNLDDEVFPQDVLFFSLELLQTAAVRNVSSKSDPSRNPMKNFVARVRWIIHPRFSGWLLNSWVSLEKE